MTALMHQVALASRAPARVFAAETAESLFDTLSDTLHGAYRNLRRYELYVGDRSANLVPVPSPSGAKRRGIGSSTLLEPLKERLFDPERGLARAHRFPAPQGLVRGSLMSAPLLDHRSLAGLIVVEAAPATSDFTTFDLRVLQGIATLFSLALQRLRSRDAGHTRPDFELDRRSARRVQRRLMNGHLPASTGVRVDARYLPALDVGGDFYELVDLGDGKVGGAIGDVSGKGVSAALVMSRVSSDIRRVLRSGVGPAAVLREVNDTLQDGESETFVTAASIRLDVRSRLLSVANAGHLPLLVRRASGDAFTFGPPSGTPLGMMPSDYADEEIALAPEDIVVMMTDGVVDALDRPSDRMGMDFLLGLVRRAPHDPEVINERVLETVARRSGGKPLDDVTLVALQLDAR